MKGVKLPLQQNPTTNLTCVRSSSHLLAVGHALSVLVRKIYSLEHTDLRTVN